MWRKNTKWYQKEESDQVLEDVKVDSCGPRVQEILARELGRRFRRNSYGTKKILTS